MIPPNNWNREEIKQRILSTALDLWRKQAKGANPLDPLVQMLGEVCAVELERLGEDLRNAEARILARLANMLTPDTFTGPKPAHTIAFVEPSEAEGLVSTENQFFVSKTSYNPELDLEIRKDIYFSPAASLPIWNIQLTYMVVQGGLFEVDWEGNKETLSRDNAIHAIPPSEIWLGFSAPDEISSLNNFRLFFDWPEYDVSAAEKKELVQLLASGKWSVGNDTLHPTIGYNLAESFDDLTNWETNLKVNKRIEHQVLEFYAPSFVTLSPFSTIGDAALPQVIADAFGEHVFDNEKTCFWINIKAPGAFPMKRLTQMKLRPNCFPTINRRLHEVKLLQNQAIQLLPLDAPGFFLDIQEVKSDSGLSYSSKALDDFNVYEAGTYTIRNGGINRFDERNAASLLSSVGRLLDDEVKSFSAMGKLSSSEVDELKNNINQIRLSLPKEPSLQNGIPYLSLHSEESGKYISIKFWNTAGAAVNHLDVNAWEIEASTFPEINEQRIQLLLSPQGGRDAVSEEKEVATLKNSFNRSFITRDRIVTQADIRAVCKEELGKRLHKVRTSKGVKIATNPKEGYIRTIEVELIASDLTEEDLESFNSEWDDEKKQRWLANMPKRERQVIWWEEKRRKLEVELNTKSTGICPIQVTIHSKS